MNKFKRFLIGLVFAFGMAGLTLFIAQAKTQPVAVVIQQASNDCSTCHQDFQTPWASSAHGHANSDPIFNQEWVDQGKPGACLVCHVTGYDPSLGTWEQDGVACQACHSPVQIDHPNQPMPIDRSADLCGRCHSAARFGVAEWQTSTHFQRGMSCTVCHDPHTAALKTVAGMEEKGPSGLCINCHSEVSMNFPYSKHNQAGVSCVECHLRHFEQDNQDVHSMPDHSFAASLSTCSTCHADQMHKPGEISISTDTTPTVLPEATPTPVSAVTDQPKPVSPAGFAGLAGLLGLAGGMVLQPWLEKLYHQLNSKKGEKK